MLTVQRAVKSIVHGIIKHGKSMTRGITTAPMAPAPVVIKESSTIDPMAWGTYRPYGPLKASLTESNQQEMS
jgi:hypothetical protein